MIVCTNTQVFDGVNNALNRVNVTVAGERTSGVCRAPPDPDAEVIDCADIPVVMEGGEFHGNRLAEAQS